MLVISYFNPQGKCKAVGVLGSRTTVWLKDGETHKSAIKRLKALYRRQQNKQHWIIHKVPHFVQEKEDIDHE